MGTEVVTVSDREQVLAPGAIQRVCVQTVGGFIFPEKGKVSRDPFSSG